MERRHTEPSELSRDRIDRAVGLLHTDDVGAEIPDHVDHGIEAVAPSVEDVERHHPELHQGVDPVASGRAGSVIQSDHEPTYRRGDGRPAASMATMSWQDVSPDPQYTTTSP